MRRALSFLAFSALLIALLTGAARRRAVNPGNPLSLDMRRSFAVTDQAILDGFPFQRVMESLVARSGTRTTALGLYRQMFDTQNPKPGLAASNAPHCDDFMTGGVASFNNLPRRCPTPEGALATEDPFAAQTYQPIALLNRFDLMPANGSNCGQYRAIFARKGSGPEDELHLIFEAALANPNPSAGIAACRPVAEFWAGLSKLDSVSLRRAELERFFFTGLPGFSPVFHPDHYTQGSSGGIRSMHALGGRIAPRFYQFRLAIRGADLIAEPDVLENLPFGRFFDAHDNTPSARAFRDEFVRNVPSLAARDTNLYFMNIPPEFLLGESNPTEGEFAFVYDIPFSQGLQVPEGKTFSDRIAAELKRVGSNLTPAQIITRAETQNCAGCHVLTGPVGEGVNFPPPAGAFSHVNAQSTESGDAGPRFAISPAMRDVFIPHRMQILKNFLSGGLAPVHSNEAGQTTIGGGRRIQ